MAEEQTAEKIIEETIEIHKMHMYLQAISLIEKYTMNKLKDKRQLQQQGRYPFERFASVTTFLRRIHHG